MFSIEAYEERKKKYIFCYLIYTSLFIVKVNSMFIITIVLKYIKKKINIGHFYVHILKT